MRIIGAVVTAFSMFSRIPMPRLSWDERNMKYMLCAFPLVGAVIGGFLWAWCWFCSWIGFGASLTSAGYVLIPLAVTGGIHLDGFCDTVDALSSHAPRERKLEILKDSHTGAFAVIGAAAYFLLDFALCCELEKNSVSAILLCCGYILERELSGLSILVFPKARKDGLANTFSGSAAKREGKFFLLILTFLTAAGVVLAFPLYGSALCAAAGNVFVYYYWVSKRQFGGVTGDLAGYFLQLCELVMTAALVLAQKWNGGMIWF